VQARFLLGPAGSGKTFHCLDEIRNALLEDPDGPPLLLLAPKQATFQLERQLLADSSLSGYTRLQILSFERLGEYILSELNPAPPHWLDDEGRVMVLRALLAQKRSELRLFPASARLPGFAAQLGLLLREFQRHQISPDRLFALAEKIDKPARLRDKLHDFALLSRAYLAWLKEHQLHDANSLLDLATTVLRSNSQPNPRLGLAGLWLDGFAEMTAQELDLLVALVPLCSRATLAFCLDAVPQAEPSWLSTWTVIGRTFLRCRHRLGGIRGVDVSVEVFKRSPRKSRFSENAVLAHLERNWAKSSAFEGEISREPGTRNPELCLASCPDPEAEAILAAREIRRFVRNGGRFRETAVLVRSLDRYTTTLRRVFDRYDIPFFLDRRESVAHHPLAELTRCALRTVAFGWRQADWFGALKTGLVPAREDEIDWLENVALESGWEGHFWLQPIELQPDGSCKSMSHMQHGFAEAERLRQRLVPPFTSLSQQTSAPLNGIQLSTAIRELWGTLEVNKTLDRWNEARLKSNVRNEIHLTVLDQMESWLDNLALAFPNETLPVRDWLPILEAGLASLSVGVIPPTLDQVLIGAIDRSRNPDLKLAIVLGLNEGVFPAAPTDDPLLTDLDREALASLGTELGTAARHRLGHEWFYGYIACTRASQRLVLACAQFDSQGNKLNRSPLFDHVERLFPNLKVEEWEPPAGFGEIEHVNEIMPATIQLAAGQAASRTPEVERRTQNAERQVGRPADTVDELLALPELADVLAKARQMAEAVESPGLSSAAAERLYGRELATSVGALEDFAACPFRFFIGRGLRAAERKRFELDARERGSFQHEVLTLFHNELVAERRKWRDLSVDEARERVCRIGRELLPAYRNGLFTANNTQRFAGEMLQASLETLISALVGWARDYQFDPELVEAAFGPPNAPWPAWRIDIGDTRALLLRGRVDRVDVWRDRATGAALFVVVDYKSSSRKPDRLKLYHGVQLQLPVYVAALEQLPEVRNTLRASSLAPAGVFYINLRGEFASARTRAEAMEDSALKSRLAFQHFGRYDAAVLKKLDPHSAGEQFRTTSRSQDRMDSKGFRDLLDRTVENLRRLGSDIFSGKIAPDPYRKGSETACDYCDYASVCRFDPWTQPFRALQEP
jgi:ATP-dependent helicase/nuclease subunit B